MEPANKGNQTWRMPPLFAGMSYAFIIMGTAALLVSLILLLTSQNEKALPTYAYVIHTLALLSGGYVNGKRTGTRGWYHGGILGAMYSLIVLIVAFLGFDQGISLHTLFFILAAFLLGALGGIFGVNSSRMR